MRISFLVWLALGTMAAAAEIEIAAKRYPIDIDGVRAFLPFESSHDLSARDDSITRVIYSIHSASYDAKSYFRIASELAGKVPSQKSRTLIIAPHILPQEYIEHPEDANILYWEFTAFWGTSRGIFNNKRVRISSYEATDRILEDVAMGGNFPNLKTIVIVGHSGGGQMVNRYAATGVFESRVANPMGMEVRYIVAAPSSYLYFNQERVVDGNMNKFAIPETAPEGFNRWGYGLEKMFAYHEKFQVAPESVISHYASKRVLYLVGSEDNNPSDGSLDKKPPAMLQGRHRLERAELYYEYLTHVFGDSIKQNQQLDIVRGAGHSGRKLLLSPQAIRFVFAENSDGFAVSKLPLTTEGL